MASPVSLVIVFVLVVFIRSVLVSRFVFVVRLCCALSLVEVLVSKLESKFCAAQAALDERERVVQKRCLSEEGRSGPPRALHSQTSCSQKTQIAPRLVGRQQETMSSELALTATQSRERCRRRHDTGRVRGQVSENWCW